MGLVRQTLEGFGLVGACALERDGHGFGWASDVTERIGLAKRSAA
jgi:hypothetical protein